MLYKDKYVKNDSNNTYITIYKSNNINRNKYA